MSRTRPIASAELRALLKVLPDAAALAVRISADTGLRISDVLAIRSGDLAPTMQVTERKTGKARRVRSYRTTAARYTGRYAPLRPNWAIRISPCIASASITQGNTAARMDWLQHSERCNTTI